MSTPPRLSDPKAIARNHARLRDEALFLKDAAADEIEYRLQLVNRTFTAPLIVGPLAARFATRLGLPDAVCVDADEVLDVTPGAHDLAIHAMALHWANDPVGQLIQTRRALKPDGLLLACLFGGQTLHELRAALAEAESRLTGGLSPRVAPMAEIRDLGALLQRAGLALPVADSDRLTVTYPDAFALMRDLRHMGEANALHHRLRRPTRRAVLAEAARIYAETHADADGRIPATFEIIHLSGWAPDDSQPQPLRPGSATHRLAQALGTAETPLED
ncbi:SAM-dependent methyltransferase [Oceanicola sp. 22II-s10i]|uniref:SAM-dependent methyltransferase n=1 Tax=Oceanicola sp. 22II-s10i TaxID=1317116 RepID=UPI000B523375|nr:SAM-dependent methyltransferase [Oceanicola sp. 22II-s10i]OWU86009.1 SAM-dependent methyltransferase [Oceanicola sp. 22II-s10i]